MLRLWTRSNPDVLLASQNAVLKTLVNYPLQSGNDILNFIDSGKIAGREGGRTIVLGT